MSTSAVLQGSCRCGRLVATLLVVVGLSIGMSGSAVVLTQTTGLVGETSFVAGSGNTVTWSSSWTTDEGNVITADTSDVVFLTNNVLYVVVALGDIADVDNARGLFMGFVGGETESATFVDQGTSGAVSYWLDLVPLGDQEYGSFTLARVSADTSMVTITMFMSPVPEFAEGLAQAQTNIAIDGAALFDGVGGEGLQDLLEANAGAAETTPSGSSNSLKGDQTRTAEGDGTPIEGEEWTDSEFGPTITWDSFWVEDLSGEIVPLVLESPDDSGGIIYEFYAANGLESAYTLNVEEETVEVILGVTAESYPQSWTIPTSFW